MTQRPTHVRLASFKPSREDESPWRRQIRAVDRIVLRFQRITPVLISYNNKYYNLLQCSKP